MFCSTNNPAIKRFNRRFMVAMALYIAIMLLSVWAFKIYHPSGGIAYILAVLPSLPILGMLAMVGMYLTEEKDEFLRNAQIQALIWGMGATLAVTTVWGCLEDFAHVRHMDLVLVYPMYWFFVGVSTVLVKLRYK